MRYLTKSRFRLGIDCPAKLYYTKKEKLYANTKDLDTFMQALASGGFQVEELARLHYPGGTLIEDDRSSKNYYSNALDSTIRALNKSDDAVIYEAAFSYEKLFIRTDILVKKGNDVQLIEVKSRSFDPNNLGFFNKNGSIKPGWISTFYDVAFQKHVIEKSHPEWNVSAYLLMADKTKKASVDGLNQMFRKTDKGNRTGIDVMVKTHKETGDSVLGLLKVDEYLNRIYNGQQRAIESMDFYDMIDTFSEYYSKDEKINWPIGWHCKKCEFKTNEETRQLISGFDECWKKQKNFTDSDLKKPNIFEIGNFRKAKLLDSGIFFMEELVQEDVGSDFSPYHLTSQERQWVQVEKALELNKNGKADFYLDIDNLSTVMNNEWKYPLHFIDFETSQAALPYTKGRKPYEQVAFQFSHHIVYEGGRIAHQSEYIHHKAGVFPNFEFVRILKEALSNDNGSVFKFAKHENTILNAIYTQLGASNEPDKEELRDFIRTITKSVKKSAEQWEGDRNMIDLCEEVKKYFYHPYMKGSYSIKKVLPTVLRVSDHLYEKYSQTIGQLGISSKNFPDNHIWIKEKDISPYDALPAVDLSVIKDSVSGIDRISDGGAALSAYAKLQYTNMSDQEREVIKNALLKYCELDTLAMVMIWEFFKFVCDNK